MIIKPKEGRTIVYIVRHGQSEGNINHTFQHPDEPLTAHGREQAAYIAERLIKLPVDLIMTSTLPRAMETGDIIAAKVNKPIERSELFIERKRASAQAGKPKDDEEGRRIEDLFWESMRGNPTRHSDEEMFEELKERAGIALEHVAVRPEGHIVVVTHGFFSRVLVARAMFGEQLSGYECERFLKRFQSQNTGITVLVHETEPGKEPWWLYVWNDHAHLG